MLKIENLTKHYRGGNCGIHHINLEVQAGDIYGFLGSNGAGKTTTIKCVTGIHDFDHGEITINGLSLKRHALECKQVMAYIPDNPDLYENMSGIHYLNFIADIYKMNQFQRTEEIEHYANLFNLTEFLGNSISSYSHGMKQKLAIISAVMHHPKLLLLDEPFVGLDPKAAFELKKIMKSLVEKGTAIFISSHVLEVVEKLCNKIAIIQSGSIIANGETELVKGHSSLEQVFLELTRNE
ncbi:ATP-binding cassette domain-containing protein [Terrilactibacillus sp. BCM23-1]|uniref:ATP-binding cassette domain-containing protein n=1 Tax=Terrilactibacillus tamarindi TaxID=2599694 RepID=A0A6N8CUB2_9BACI|nr:ABC transporter ATP-binding protein [Terrilactibacillus tamarindi]MTT32887.1 ATP-binding cassette domain-containing protein [Terrilactibacillus tamarindi]